MRKTHLICLTVLIAAAFALAGCGGSKSRAIDSDGSAGGVVLTASRQVAAASYVQQWSEILWGVVTNQTGTQTPSMTDPIYNPEDDSFTSTLTTADGTQAIITTFMDGSARIEITRPDGATQTVTQSAPAFDGGTTVSTDWAVSSSDGLEVTYTSIVDDQGTWWDMSDDTTLLSGSATLSGGITQTFEVSTAAGETTLRSVQSDGSTFTLRVPLTSPDSLPDYSRDAAGTYASGDFSMSFTLTRPQAQPDTLRWAVMSSDFNQQMTGEFSLGNDFSGYGQLQETGSTPPKLSAILTWTQHGDSRTELLGGETRQTRPAGAALDFLKHRWQTLTAMMGPSPGF